MALFRLILEFTKMCGTDPRRSVPRDLKEFWLMVMRQASQWLENRCSSIFTLADGQLMHIVSILSFISLLLHLMVKLQKFVYRLIVMFLSTEIFSKRRKIYSWMKRNQSAEKLSCSKMCSHFAMADCGCPPGIMLGKY